MGSEEDGTDEVSSEQEKSVADKRVMEWAKVNSNLIFMLKAAIYRCICIFLKYC